MHHEKLTDIFTQYKILSNNEKASIYIIHLVKTNNIMKKILILTLLLLPTVLHAQQKLTLDLQQTIRLANDSSLESFRAQNMYLSGYWEYRSYRANRLPSLTLDLTPAQYYRDITRRYDSDADIAVYRSQQSFSAYGSLSIQQNLDLTGGTFYANTSLGYMRNFGSNKYTQYTSVPFQIGYTQELIGYNAFRWERKIEPRLADIGTGPRQCRQYPSDSRQQSETRHVYFGIIPRFAQRHTNPSRPARSATKLQYSSR